MLSEPTVIVFLSVGRELENAGREFGETGCMVGNVGRELGDAGREFGDAGCEVGDIGRGLGNAGRKSGTAGRAGFPKAKKLSLLKVTLEVFMIPFWIRSYSLYILVVLYM